MVVSDVELPRRQPDGGARAARERRGEAARAHTGHAHDHAAATIGLVDAALAITVHVGAMLAVMALVALVVYEKLGLSALRKAWINSDRFWAGAFVVAAAVTLAG